MKENSEVDSTYQIELLRWNTLKARYHKYGTDHYGIPLYVAFEDKHFYNEPYYLHEKPKTMYWQRTLLPSNDNARPRALSIDFSKCDEDYEIDVRFLEACLL